MNTVPKRRNNEVFQDTKYVCTSSKMVLAL